MKKLVLPAATPALVAASPFALAAVGEPLLASVQSHRLGGPGVRRGLVPFEPCSGELRKGSRPCASGILANLSRPR